MEISSSQKIVINTNCILPYFELAPKKIEPEAHNKIKNFSFINWNEMVQRLEWLQRENQCMFWMNKKADKTKVYDTEGKKE